MRRKGRLAALAVAALAVGAGAWAWNGSRAPYQGFTGEVFYELKRGTGTVAMARELAAMGVVKSPWHFLVARLARPRVALQAGEYRFAQEASAAQVLDRIVRGDVYFVVLTVPEGSNLFETGELIERHGLGSADAFRKAASDAAGIQDLAPGATTLEGYLFPSTYQLGRRTDMKDLCHRMTAEFRRVWKELGGGANVQATVTLASLVEKETAVPEERALVAGVYRNRLEAGMRLDCDPTVIYAALLAGRWRGAIYRSDLQRTHAYNTYRVAGLPPGPIANPGRASLEAALRPAETTAVYFVAKPGGGGRHVFSGTLAAHERAVASYRRGTARQRGGKAPAVAGRKKARAR